MNIDDKPRADAKLQTLPEDIQAQIVDFALTTTLGDTVVWLHQQSTVTSISGLSQFDSWYRLKQQLARNESAILSLLADLAKLDPALSAARLYEAAHIFFAASALEKQV